MSAHRFARGVAMGAALLLAVATATAQVAVPKLSQQVTDLTGTLSGAAVARIETKLADLQAKKGIQLAVLVVPTTEPEDIAQFGIRVGEAWKLGRKGVDDGAILIVAKNDRRVRLEVGYGLEGAMPDAIANRIITETITPHFKQGDYDGGVEAGIDQMISVVKGEPLPEPDKKWERHGGMGGLTGLLPLLMVAVFVVSGVLRRIFGRMGGSVATGGLVGGAAWLLSSFIPIGIGAGVLGFLFALLMGSSSGWTNGGGFGGLGGLGGLGGGRGGGFGGGGFGGGGGGFGGGGASGGW